MVFQQNHILSRLAPRDFELLEPSLEVVDLPLRKVLDRGRRKITAIYFPDSGFASVVANGREHPIEVGLIGREGMSGLAILFGSDRDANETFMQAPGRGRQIAAHALREAIDQSATLHRSMLRYAHSFLEQTMQTAVSNARNKIEERLARWLLMADDRIDGDELPLTHEFLAMMLGVRRPGVTIAVQELQRAGVIAQRRGRIVITDRAALEKLSNGTYVPAE